MSLPTITPYLSVQNALDAVDFYCKAFGALETGPRLNDPNGKIMHTELTIGDSKFMLADEFPEYGNHSPSSLGGTCVRISLEVEDVDSVADKAVQAGAKILIPIADQVYGYRSGRLGDPFGHEWIVSTRIEQLTEDEMQQRMKDMFNNSGN